MLKVAGAEKIYEHFVELYEKMAKYISYDRTRKYKELNKEELKEYIPILIEQNKKIKEYMNSFKTDAHN